MSKKYKEAGVDIQKAGALIEELKREISRTYTKSVLVGVGGFGALIDIDFSEFREPVVAISTDGVGTKLLLAREYDKLEGIGIDLVAMNVDDVVCTGAKPIGFVDYFACGKLKDEVFKRVMRSIIRGCEIAGVPLVGGETAEMPGMYEEDEFELSGTAVGIADRSNILPKNVKEGDKLIALSSSGFHSNGFSLIRKILKEKGINPEKEYGFGKPLIDLLLEPTRIYCNDLYPLIAEGKLKGLAHITGGGLTENILRVTQGRKIRIFEDKVIVPEVMEFIISEGKVSREEAFEVFNMGVGMVIITDKEDEVIDKLLSSVSYDVYLLGEVI